MIKKVMVVLFISGSSYVGAVTITTAQAQAVNAAAIQIEGDALKLVSLAQLVLMGGTYQIQGSTQAYTLSPQQNQDIVNYYENIKNDVCSVQCGNLP